MKKSHQLLIIVAMILVIYPSIQAHAKTQVFPDMNLEITLPEDTIVLTKDTPDTDGQWKEAGIIDPQSEKDTFDDMGVQAILYDPESKTRVSLLQKQSSESQRIFNLSLLLEEELTIFFDSLTTANDENTKFSIEKYPQSEVTFFRFSIEAAQDNVPITELIYGTIINGYLISYDIFQENSTEPLDETYIKELVEGTHFTKIQDKAEVEQLERKSLIQIAIFFIITIALIAMCIMIGKKQGKKKQSLKKRKSEELTKFYTEQKRKEEQGIKDDLLFINRTKYSKELLKDFYTYNEVLKNIKQWVITALFLIGLVFMFGYEYSIMISIAVVFILLFISMYLIGIRIEKLMNQTIKSYDKKNDLNAILMFYDNYLTLSGIQYISKYPYTQITEIKEYKDYIFIYFGSNKAIYLKKDGFEQGAEDFIHFIKQQLT